MLFGGRKKMEVNIVGQLLNIVSKPWSYEGKSGVSHKLIIYSDDKLYHVKIHESRIQYYKENIGNTVSVVGKIFINGMYSISEIDAF